MKKLKFRYQLGAFLMFVIYGGLFFLLFSRFFYIQSTGEVYGYNLQAEAANKYARETVLAAERGRILDRNENIIAEDTLSYRLIAVVSKKATTNSDDPRHVIDAREAARILAQYISWDEEKIYEQLTKEGDPYQVEFGAAGRSISHEVKEAIEAHKIPGIIFVTDKKRYYPNGSFAAHLIGYATKEQQEDGTFKTVGKMGLEKTYNEELTGEDGKVAYDSDFFGYLIADREKMMQPAKNGSDIYLTLDKTVQNFLDDAMNRVEEKYNPESMIAVVADPKTGEILGMSQRPTFDPDTRIGLEDSWLNKAIEDVLEPGSTMKTFTLAAAIDSGNWHPNATYKSGKYTLYDSTIKDHNNGRGWGTITYLEGFQRSSNTAMAYMLEIMGSETYLDYVERFGFGQKTGINLPNEATGTILAENPIGRLTTTYGQGSTVTPIQLIQAATAVANDGKMMQPYVIDKIVDTNTGKVTYNQEPVVKGEPISADTAKQVREILASTVTSEAGTAYQRYEIEGYEVAGKTGTAEIPKEKGVGYQSGTHQYIYSFLGMAPADDPQLVMYVAVKKPKMSSETPGSQPVSEVFNSVMGNSLKYLNINPDDTAKAEMVTMPNTIEQQVEAVQVELVNDGLQPVIIGEGGTIIDQYPKADTPLIKGSLVFLKTSGASTLPTFTGWSLRNVLVYKTLSGLPIEIVGEGYVYNQSASPNTLVMDSSPIVVKLRTPKESFNIVETETDEEPLPQD